MDVALELGAGGVGGIGGQAGCVLGSSLQPQEALSAVEAQYPGMRDCAGCCGETVGQGAADLCG